MGIEPTLAAWEAAVVPELPILPKAKATRRWPFYLQHLVEVAGIEPASVSPLPLVLHA